MENSKNAKGSKLNTYLLLFIAVTSVVLVCVAIVVLIVVWSPGGNGGADETPVAAAQVTQESGIQTWTDDGVLKRIESTNVLQTTVFRIDTVVRAKKEGSWFLDWGGQNLLFFVQGVVTAGVDLGELGEENIQVSQDSQTIVITLPPAKVLRAEIEHYFVEDYEGQPPDKAYLDLIEQGLEAGREQVAMTACESEILKYATTDAERAFSQIVSFAEFTGYEVVIKTQPVTECSIEVDVKE